MRYKTTRTEEFKDWLVSESLKSQVQIEKRISKIETDGHFGTCKEVEDNGNYSGRYVCCKLLKHREHRGHRGHKTRQK